MEFHVYNVAGQKRILEDLTKMEHKDKAIYFYDKNGEVRWWVNPSAVAFIEYRKTQDEKRLEVISK